MATETTSRLGLTSDRILDAAVEVLDEEGLAGVSMRRVADRLGVGTMTIYGYFRTKDDLLDALVDRCVALIPAPSSSGPWKQRLRDLLLAMQKTHEQHPGVIELRLHRPLITPRALAVTEIAMQILLDAGFSPEEAARAYRTLFVYTFGFCAFGPGDRGPNEREATRKAIAALPRAEYPALTRSAREAARAMADAGVFELGLDCLLDGLEARQRASA